jgi:hypothetical protein
VFADWETGQHRLTYRQTERTFGLVARALGKDEPDGLPSDRLQGICDITARIERRQAVDGLISEYHKVA